MVKVTVDRLLKKFGGVVAVDDVSFEAAEGCFITLLGPSGCGKTTTLRCIAGLEAPDGGSISFDGIQVASGKNIVPPEKREVGMVFQSYAIWPHMTVYDNVAFPLKIKKTPREEINSRVTRIIDIVRLSGLERRYATQLSGGQQQRVAFARALVSDPKVLLLDEPLSNLDAKLRESMRLELKEIQKSLGITTVYVTHDQVEAMVLSDTVVVLDRGEVQQTGSPDDLYNKPGNRFVADFIGSSNLIHGKVIEILSAEGLASIETQIGILSSFTDAPNLRKGDEVLLAIRPENIDLIERSKEGYKARVSRRLNVGEALIYWLDVSGLDLCVRTHPSIEFRDGMDVSIRVRPEYCKVIRE